MLYLKDRDALVKETWQWVGTPYRGWSRTKRYGADCIGLVAGVYVNCGHLTKEEADASIPKGYSLQHGQHEATTEYVDGILKFMDEIQEHEARPADVVMFKLTNSLAYAHSAIIVNMPMIIHSTAHGGVRAADIFKHPMLLGASRRYFTLQDGR